ncbi:MAG: hypothetical protein H6730_37830 [Deltaproteobacteria bacterium]|nr:hypothetical protein [Deltaproteobacteria bacterium]
MRALLALTITLAFAATDEARALNTRGYRLYKQKKYGEAAQVFSEAIDADATYALPYYNLACTLSLLRAQGKICDHDAYRSSIIELLQDAVRLDPSRRKRLATDKDLDAVRDTFGYYKLIGLSVKNPRDLRKILVAVTWYGPSPGAYGPMAGADFHADGTLSTWSLDFPEDGSVRRVPGKGTWRLEGTRVLIKAGAREVAATLGEDGVLRFEDESTMTDDPDECSA